VKFGDEQNLFCEIYCKRSGKGRGQEEGCKGMRGRALLVGRRVRFGFSKVVGTFGVIEKWLAPWGHRKVVGTLGGHRKVVGTFGVTEKWLAPWGS
jgi:hypothetical protein